MQRPVPAKPTEANLREAALRHLARYATTTTGLIRVLNRRIDRFARATETDTETLDPLRRAVKTLVADLARAGAVDDAGFAAARARTLHRAGRSRHAIAGHLAARGATLPAEPTDDLAAAAAAIRRRRLGPFRTTEADPRRELGTLARAGFPQDIARAALALSREEAEALIAALRA